RTSGMASALYASGLATIACSGKGTVPVNKREAILELIHGDKPQDYIPGGFFMHFDKQFHTGEAAMEKHLEYFHHTGMDFIKIQYEHEFPKIPDIQKPGDWANIPLYKKNFFEQPLEVIGGIINKAKNEAPVIATLYSPCACAGHTTSNDILNAHLEENPEQVKKGLEIITESLITYVKECIKLGVDGFLQSTVGGEGGRFSDYSLFTEYLKPFDLIIGKEMEDHCQCNVLHICDGFGNYDDYSAFLDYPGHIINSSLQLRDGTLSAKDMYRLFNKPFMGGMHKRGVLTSGTHEEIISEVNDVLDEAPDKFILAATCTVPSDTSWDNLKIALDTAHKYQKT
ncbi:uroporphyrinogen decarboxylase family protein, partial [Bacteroidota bacterium]